jgi:hypothetical protein
MYSFENDYADPEYPFYDASEWIMKRFPKMYYKQKEELIIRIKVAAIDVVAEENFASYAYINHGIEVII